MADETKPRAAKRARKAPPTTADPIEIAMGAEAGNRSDDSPAQEVLRGHSRLLDEQLKHVRLQAFSERMGAGLKLLTGLAALIVAGVLATMVWTASRDRSLVIQAFNTPPELQARGLTGEVIAAKLLDKLAAIDANADSFRAPETFRNDWGDDIQIEIPQTGVSIGELDRYLRQWLGRRTGIGGEVIRNPDGTVALTVRAGSGGAVTRTGAEAELDILLQQTAEAVFERTQPFRYSKYLEAAGRMDEAMTTARRLADTGPPEERPWAWAQISNLQLEAGDMRAAAAAARRAVELDPELGLGWLNLSIAEGNLGHDRAAAAAVNRSVDLLLSGRGKLSATGIAIGKLNAAAAPISRGDFEEAWRLQSAEEARTNYLAADDATVSAEAYTRVSLHQLRRAESLIARAPPDFDASRFSNQNGDLYAPHAFLAVALEDWTRARDSLRAVVAESKGFGGRYVVVTSNTIVPFLAIAEARTGNSAEAQRLADGLAADCAACVEAKAWVAELAGDRVAADLWFARYQRQAVEGPFAPASWGRARLARGDARGALVLFQQAQRQGPRWADGFKLGGDALMQLNRPREAVAAYREAVERTPEWGAAHIGYGRALAATGAAREAREAWATATRLVLTPSEREALAAARTG